MKRLIAGVVTAALMTLLVGSGLRRGADPGRFETPSIGAEDPGSVVESLIGSAGRGDLSGYLGVFTGPLKDRLAREAGERGHPAFAEDLRRVASARKGYALFAVESDGPDAARVPVESVFPDRIERQTYRLERIGGRWLVAEVETTRSHQPRAKFGSPADFRGPEGAPVEPADNTGAAGDDSP